MTRLLCATDLLPKSESSIDRAGLLAEELGADLSLLHVVAPTASDRVLEQSLQIAIDRMKSRVRPPLWRRGPMPRVLVRAGNPARQLLATIERERPDLLIVGPHERRSVLDGLTGTIAEKALNARKCPLLMVQKRADAGYRNVLFALDLSVESALAVRAAESLGITARAQPIVVHVCEPPLRGMVPSTATSEAASYARSARSAAVTAIHDLLKRESADFARYEVVVTEGPPTPAILHAVGTHEPDLLVVGTRSAGRIRGTLLGSVASQVLKEVTCDVLVVPRDPVAASLSNSCRSDLSAQARR